MTLVVSASRESLFEATAERFEAAAAAAIRQCGRFQLALAGGDTPRGLYALLASQRHRARVDWSRVHVFWGDERCVEPQDPASNQRMARETLLDHVPVPASHVHAIHGADDPTAAAREYERALREAFATPVGPPRSAPGARFDLVILGLGEDGHTASLFAGSPAIHEAERWVLATWIAKLSAWRITLTPLVINAAREVIFLVSGRAKAAALRRVLRGPCEPNQLPSQVIQPRDGELRWLVDADAASCLDDAGERLAEGSPG